MKKQNSEQESRPFSAFRSNAAALIDQVSESKRPIVIAKRGKSAALLLGLNEYEALLEKLEILQDVRQAEAQLREGKGIEHEQARNQVLASLTDSSAWDAAS